MQEELPKLDYAVPQRLAPRHSKLALAAFALPILGLPLGVIVTKALEGQVSRHAADRVGMLAWVVASAIGLLASIIAMRRIHRAGGALRGRPIAIVGLAFSIVFLVWAIVITNVAVDL